ncbi:MAG: non-homologous end-joining DNA ligase [Nitrospiraceae bacterium]|jgi:bifunctional non-homologous end joining protein LigD|nr:non-homologous end-joining DNA ligase [Nitrospirota bacterium]MDA8338776.1 non-homologous end-joining DNA ligase [Nitrospiraceae bacterium]
MTYNLNIKPMLAKSSNPFDSENHIFELKWDGTRCIAFVDKSHLSLKNRRLLDITHRYPEFQQLKKHLKVKSAVFDGEIIVLKEGIPNFERLQQREHIEDIGRIEILSGLIPAAYVVFDLLYLNGKSLMKKPLIERRDLLKELFPMSENVILSESYSEGRKLFKMALKKGFEGIMAKEKTSPYLSGERSGYWLKIKKSFDIDAVVCGYLEGEGSRKDYFGSLILGVYDNGELIHIGQVGTGIDEKTIKHLFNILSSMKTDTAPFDIIPELKRKAFWCRPEVVVRVGYQEWTKDNRLRIPVFKGIRDDKGPEECII